MKIHPDNCRLDQVDGYQDLQMLEVDLEMLPTSSRLQEMPCSLGVGEASCQAGLAIQHHYSNHFEHQMEAREPWW